MYDLHCKFEVLQVTRLNRRQVDENGTQYIPTKTCVVSFKSQVLPKYITINKVLKEVEPYKQKVLLCFNCLRFGHTGGQCKSKARCDKCQESHNSKDCKKTDLTPKCFNCSGDHFTTNLSACQEFQRQKLIKDAMSSNNISYQDANKQFPSNSYAKVTSINTEQTTNLSCLKTFPPLNPNNYTPTQFPSNPINKMSTNNIFYNNNSNSTNSRTFKRQTK
ncbi:uncharacterized protein LOC126891073 [Diabrotica virgifera virgifera]|uniref:Nucleic-acid-binding protein from mobile element jockey n=1 Tax=Diabrotica virgifera virgifera TaxID=50390 RepID=A0ABM5L193_DIAVI|nr:uncharacterized protein LOC126891073 [Diabrotica virgifera virgifera]